MTVSRTTFMTVVNNKYLNFFLDIYFPPNLKFLKPYPGKILNKFFVKLFILSKSRQSRSKKLAKKT